MSYVDLYILLFLPISFCSLVKGWAELTSTPFAQGLILKFVMAKVGSLCFLYADFVSMLFGSYGGLAGSFSWFNLYILL